MIQFFIPYPKPRTIKGKKRTFAGEYGLNAIYAGKHWTRRKADSDFWHGYVLQCLLEQGIKKKVYDCPVEIKFSWDDKLDCSNHAYAAKMIEDALKGYLIADDSRKYVSRIIHEFNRKKIITVTIREDKNGD